MIFVGIEPSKTTKTNNNHDRKQEENTNKEMVNEVPKMKKAEDYKDTQKIMKTSIKQQQSDTTPSTKITLAKDNSYTNMIKISMNTTTKFEVSTNRVKFCLVHIGKTAGSKFAFEVLYLKEETWYRHLNCKHKVLPSVLRDTNGGKMHQWTFDNSMCPKFDVFLYTLRKPLDCIILLFHYERYLINASNGRYFCS